MVHQTRTYITITTLEKVNKEKKIKAPLSNFNSLQLQHVIVVTTRELFPLLFLEL